LLKVTDLTKTLDTLIDGWCERRALRPLQYLLRAYPAVLAHTDQFEDVLDALKDVKGLARKELTEKELADVIACINLLEDFVSRRR
jgi:hypothetical protein